MPTKEQEKYANGVANYLIDANDDIFKMYKTGKVGSVEDVKDKFRNHVVSSLGKIAAYANTDTDFSATPDKDPLYLVQAGLVDNGNITKKGIKIFSEYYNITPAFQHNLVQKTD